MGTPDFAVASLQAIYEAGHEVAAVVTVPDRQTGRGLKITESPVKQYAKEKGLKILQPERLRDEAFQAELRSLGATLFVVVAFRMLPQSVWAMPPMGTFNLHASLLPQYRGAAPINWALINGEKETGVTTFLLNEHIDEGAILMQESTPIVTEDNVESLHDRLAEIGRHLVLKTIEGLEQGTLHPVPQPAVDAAQIKPAPKIFKADCAIDWSKRGEEIFNFVRGLAPYPAATMQLVDLQGAFHDFKIYDVEFEPKIDGDKPVGTLITDQKNELKISVIDGFIKIKSLQLSGKRKVSVQEFLRGYVVNDWKLVYNNLI